MVDVKYYNEKINWGRQKSLPMMQGEAINKVIREFRIPAGNINISWGYYMDVIGIKTSKQIMFWKDDGCKLSFAGVIDRITGDVQYPKPKPEDAKAKPVNKIFKTVTQLSKECERRDYKNIKGLRAEISEKEYTHFLEVLPPLSWSKGTFYLSEFLSGNLTYKFTMDASGKCFCTVADYREEHPTMTEEQYLETKY